MQGGLHSHAPHNFQQQTKIYNRDPTLMLTYYEPSKNQMFSKFVKSPSPPLTTFFV
jgi:hypothetical protein